jgi:hypothetical protein
MKKLGTGIMTMWAASIVPSLILVANGNRRHHDLANSFVTPTKPTYATSPYPVFSQY